MVENNTQTRTQQAGAPTYWQDPTNTLDGLTLIEAEQRNRERENATGPTVVVQLQAALTEFETNQPENKGVNDDR